MRRLRSLRQGARGAGHGRGDERGFAGGSGRKTRRQAARDLGDAARRDATEETVTQLAALAGAGRHHHRRRPIRSTRTTSAARKHWPKRTSATSIAAPPAAIWGIERGYCMMIGGPKEAVDFLDPIFSALAPGGGDIPRTPGRDKGDPRAERGYIHAGPSGAGHFVKMVHNGIEYGLMQAYAEGFDILRNRNSQDLPGEERFDLDLPDIAEVWRRGSVISSWLLDLGAAALARGSGARNIFRLRAGFRRGPLDRRGRDRGIGSSDGPVRRALCAVPLAARPWLWREIAVGPAAGLRRPRRRPGARRSRAESRAKACAQPKRPGEAMSDLDKAATAQMVAQMMDAPPRRAPRPADPCAMVLFGATGDLTHRLVIPALYNLSRTGALPEQFTLIGVARADITTEDWRDDLYRSLKNFVGAAQFRIRGRRRRRRRVAAARRENGLCAGRPVQS